MILSVRKHDVKYKNNLAENQLSNWLERKLVAMEDELKKLSEPGMLG